MSYAVVWSEDSGPLFAGSLALEARTLRFDGRADETTEHARELPYREIAGVAMERRSVARLGGRPTLVLALRSGSLLRLASVIGAGSLRELADRVEGARADESVAPSAPGSLLDAAAALGV